MFVRRGVAAAALALACAGLAGCGGDDDPEPKFTDSPESESTSATSSPTASETAAQETPEEFIRRWQEVANAMQVTGDTADFRQVSGPCRSCNRFADTVDGIYDDGGSIETSGSRVISVRQQSVVDGITTLDVVSSSSATRVTRGSGKVENLPGGKATFRFRLRHNHDGWHIVAYSVLG